MRVFFIPSPWILKGTHTAHKVSNVITSTDPEPFSNVSSDTTGI